VRRHEQRAADDQRRPRRTEYSPEHAGDGVASVAPRRVGADGLDQPATEHELLGRGLERHEQQDQQRGPDERGEADPCAVVGLDRVRGREDQLDERAQEVGQREVAQAGQAREQQPLPADPVEHRRDAPRWASLDGPRGERDGRGEDGEHHQRAGEILQVAGEEVVALGLR
jgi:hypothetical protein